MTMQRLCEILCVDNLYHAKYDADLERFTKEWDAIKSQPLLDREGLDVLARDGYIDAACLPDVDACLAKIEADEELAFALQFVYYALCAYHKPWQNELYADPSPAALGDYRGTFAYILLLRVLQKSIADLRARRVPEDALDQMKGVADCGRGEPWGLGGMFHWHISCSLGTMFYQGMFRYEICEMPEGYRMFRRKADGKLLALWAGERRFDAEGQFTWDDAQTAFRTAAPASDRDGWMIRPDGVVVNRYVTLSKEEWEPAFCEGDVALSFHIPPKCRYTIEAAKETFQQAVAFYQTYFPEISLRGIQAYSWLYSPQLSAIMPPESGINRFNHYLYLCPVPSGPDGFYDFVFQTDAEHFDPDTAPTDTTLRRRFVEYVKAGGKAHNGFMYLPTADVDRLGEKPENLYAWDLFA
ncbi:MAG: hypothetical protein IJU16_06995 [Clostridia bacterium]|nr:hypothetical protein [Clostridia bacterium]